MDERTAPPPRAADHRVEVIVGVHTPARPVERAVASVLRNQVSLRVTVVAHNTDPAAVRGRLATLADDPRVRVLELSDGVRSPANAFNFGLDAAEGDFFSLVGSDDELAAGALDAWAELADRASADVVMAPIRRVPGDGVPSPRVRRGRVVRLDGDRDRLFERAAPLGLVRLARFPHLRFTTGLPRGVDQVYAMHLWFSGASIAFDPAAPAYLEHDDQTDRVTLAGGPLADDLAYLDAMESDPAFAGMTPVARRALAAKLIRVHLLGAIASRAESEAFTDADRAAVVEVLARLRGWGRGLDGLLAVRDRRALRAASAAGTSAAQLHHAVGDRSRHATWSAVLTVNPLKVLHRHAPLRSMAAGLRVARAVTRAATRNEARL
ncbi:glycosyltransferase [Microbacterium sp.]|uniref:glycosyltransferase n=1 Tax=Microbacterium sp. TaxID=51671 RepID=UPI0037CC8C59